MVKEIEVDKENFASSINLRHAIVSNIEFENGTQTKVVTIFNNNDVNYEEMNIGVNTALERINKYHKNIKHVKNSFGSIKQGTYKQFIDFSLKKFN